jgi:multidrug efflux pump subunit AcrA (membrane-fusion protein)
MYKIVVAAIAAAAMLAGVAVLVPGISDEVSASTPQPLAKGDRLDLKPVGAACSQRGWPHYEATCLRNLNSPTRQAKTVRVVTVDRLDASRTVTAPGRSLAMR